MGIGNRNSNHLLKTTTQVLGLQAPFVRADSGLAATQRPSLCGPRRLVATAALSRGARASLFYGVVNQRFTPLHSALAVGQPPPQVTRQEACRVRRTFCQPHTYRLDQNLNLRQQNRHQPSDGHRSAHSTHPSAMTVHADAKITQAPTSCDPSR